MSKKRRGQFYVLPNRKCEYATIEEQKQANQEDVEKYFLVLKSYVLSIIEAFAMIPDPRQPWKIKHKQTVLLFFAVILFALGYESRRQANPEVTEPAVLAVLRAVFPEIDTSPHMDTVARFLETVSVKEIESIYISVVKELIHNRKFQRMMVDGRYVVAIDGTQKWSGGTMWSPNLLRKTHANGNTTYQVYVLEAALVGPNQIAIPILSEFCENDPEAAAGAKKQDCELKAFYRLSARLKSLFQHTPLMIVADGLYPKGPVIEICNKYHWDFMIGLPDDCLTGVWQQAENIRDGKSCDSQPGQESTNTWGDREQYFWWANYIVYRWTDNDGNSHQVILHLVVCHETWQEEKTVYTTTTAGREVLLKELVTKEKKWAWISAKPIRHTNVLERCNYAARSRWYIEENILTEKTRGYNYEHMFSFDWVRLSCRDGIGPVDPFAGALWHGRKRLEVLSS
ncbi:MAG: transposase family protein [Peptococcaceae bacterium]|nr:transposase family protein [Peptococcaceae bacterium]